MNVISMIENLPSLSKDEIENAIKPFYTGEEVKFTGIFNPAPDTSVFSKIMADWVIEQLQSEGFFDG